MAPRRRGKGPTRQVKKGGVEKKEATKSKKLGTDDTSVVDAKDQTKQRNVGQGEAELVAQTPAPPPQYNPTSSDLEKKRLQVADELRKVEQQVSGSSLVVQFYIKRASSYISIYPSCLGGHSYI